MNARLATAALVAALAACMPSSSGQSGSNRPDVHPAGPLVRFEANAGPGGLSFLSWDTEGGGKAARNLLRAGSAVRVQRFGDGAWADASGVQLVTSAPAERPGHLEISIRLRDSSAASMVPGVLRLIFPFDPKATSTTILPAAWLDDGTFRLPAVVNAPDWGPMLLTEACGRTLVGRLEGSRADKTVDLTLDLPPLSASEPIKLIFAPLLLPPPPGLSAASLAFWPAARRGWLNALQPCARWGEQDKPFSAPPGILGNNVISDPASVSVWFYADQAFFLPEIAPGISVMPLVRRTIDYWLEKRMRRDAAGRLTGEITGYWDYGDFLDANASPLIAAWDYVESTGDLSWLALRIDRLELAADFLAGRDIDGDGLVEATQSGEPNALQQPNRSCAWWDALNCGHKEGYTNALIYRAWRSFADLERKLRRGEKALRYERLADRLRSAYAHTLYNPETGLLAWWKDRAGAFHDYISPTLNGMAIEYGLVDPNQGRAILDRLRIRLAESGFRRYDLGVPPMLIPVRRSDYLQPDALGIPVREDGTDTFGYYMNAGITAGHVLHYLAAHYLMGDRNLADRADGVLRAMLERQSRGEFQNGVRDATFEGIDWTTWEGKPSGYEGYLADSFRFLQAVLLREPEFRARLYRPLYPQSGRAMTAALDASAGKPSSARFRHEADIAFLESAVKELLEGCVLTASDGTRLYTPDGKAHYAALWTRDFASIAEYAGDLIPGEDVERCIEYLIRGIRTDGAVPDRVQVDGRPVYAAGAPENPLGEPNLDNGPYLVFAVASYLDRAPAARRKVLWRKWAPALTKGMEYVPLAPSGLVWNDPAKPHSPYGFTDTVGKTGELFMESILYWRAAKMLAERERDLGDAKRGEAWTRRARAIEKNAGSLWDEATGMFFAASRDCRQTDIWGNAFAAYAGFPLGAKKDRILGWLASNVDRYVWHGQIRHLPAGEYWDRLLTQVDKERYQNGAYWATPSGWVMGALADRHPELARKVLADLVDDFRAGGICECVNPDGYRQLPSYVNSATNPLGAARRIWN